MWQLGDLGFLAIPKGQDGMLQIETFFLNFRPCVLFGTWRKEAKRRKIPFHYYV